MDQVTGRIVSYAAMDMTRRSIYSILNQKFGNVSDSRTKLARAGGELRVVGQQYPVLFHRRSAPGGVGDYSLAPALKESIYVFPGQSLGSLDLSGVSMQCAATYLAARFN
jgi:hypothetical protein